MAEKQITLAAIAGAHGIAGEVRLKLFGEGVAELKRHRTYTALFYIPLSGALAVLLLELLLANTRFRRIP